MNARPIVVTRASADAASLVEALERRGFTSLVVPTIAIVPKNDLRELDAAVGRLDGFDWLAFTSAHAVDVVCGRPGWPVAGAIAKRPAVAAAGPATATSLARRGVTARVVAEGGRALAAAIAAQSPLLGRRVLWPHADVATPELADALRAHGAEVLPLAVYETRLVPVADLGTLVSASRDGSVQVVTFCSPSSATSLARGFNGTLQPLAGRVIVAAIGPTTADALSALGAPPDVVALRPTVEALADAVAHHLTAIGDPA